MLVQEGIRTREHVRVCNARSLHYGALARQTSKWHVFWPVLFMYKISVSHACLLATLILCWLVEEDVANLNLSNQNMSPKCMTMVKKQGNSYSKGRHTINHRSVDRRLVLRQNLTFCETSLTSSACTTGYVMFNMTLVSMCHGGLLTLTAYSKILAWWVFSRKINSSKKPTGPFYVLTAYSYFFVQICVFRNHDLEFCRARTQCVVLHTLVLVFS